MLNKTSFFECVILWVHINNYSLISKNTKFIKNIKIPTDEFFAEVVFCIFIFIVNMLESNELKYLEHNEIILNKKFITELHTTKGGEEKIYNNIGVTFNNLIQQMLIASEKEEIHTKTKGKNIYIEFNSIVVTINANSKTIITAHKHIFNQSF